MCTAPGFLPGERPPCDCAPNDPNMDFATRAIHAGQDADPTTGATSAPGKMPANAPRSSKDFAAQNKGAMGDAKTAAQYKAETTGSGK